MSETPESPMSPAEETPEEGVAGVPRKGLAGKRFRRALRWILLLVVMASVWLLQGAGGQRLVLDTLLGRVQSALAGELTVQGIRSSSLLFSATLTGVRLETEGQRPFLEADSVRIHYSAFGLVMRRPVVTGITLWAPRLEISRYPGDDGTNVRGLLRPGDEAADSLAASREINLGRIVIHDGLVEILSPAGTPAPTRVPTVPVPGGEGLLRRLALEGIQGDFGEAVLTLGDDVPFKARVRSLAMDVSILNDPLRITDASGLFTYSSAGIQLEEGAVTLPGSQLSGSLRVGPDAEGGPWRFVTDMTAAPASLGDLRWLDPRIPEGTFSGRVQVAAGGGVDVILHEVDAELEASHLTADGGFRFDGGFELRGLDVTASPLVLARLDPWLGRASPLEGWLSGSVLFDGRPEALSTSGRVTLVPTGYSGRPITADLGGVIHFGNDPGATNFGGRLDPLNFDVLEALFPRLPVRGTGSATFQLSGRVADGLRFTSEVVHSADSSATSRVLVQGSVRRDSTRAWVLDTQGDLAPLSLALVNQVQPGLDLLGVVNGSLQVVGPLGDLRITGDVDVGGGRMTVDAGADVTALAQAYRMSVQLDDVDLSQVVAVVPSPATWRGRLEVEGRGLSLDSLESSASVVAFASRVGGLHVDTVHASIRASGGELQLDTLYGILGGVTVSGSGTLGMVASQAGEAAFAFSTDSLIGLRPLFMGDSVIARDELTTLDRAVLRFEGIDPDTLPLAEEVAMSGALLGTVGLSGNFEDLNLSVSAALEDGVFRRQSLGEAEVMLEVRGLPAMAGEWDVVLDGTDLDLARWSFGGAHVELGGTGKSGRGWFEVRRTADERFGATGEFALDSAGGSVHLELATARLDSVQWQLTGPSRITWDSSAVRVSDFEASRGGADPGRVAASGVLSRTGDSDFTLESAGVHVDRLARLLQLELEDVGGHVDFSVVVRGPADDPVIDARLVAESPRYEGISADRLLSVVQYENRTASVDTEAWSEGRSVFTAEGTIPLDLSLSRRERRVPVDGIMDVQVRADSLAAAGLLAVVGSLEDVEGWVSGEFDVRGTLDEPAPSGTLQLRHGAWSVAALGVRHTDVSGLVTLYPDRTVSVAMASRAAGVSQVTGDLDFETLSNPTLDLTITFQQFQAVNRRDVTGLISGTTTVSGTYHRPVVEGALSVDQGTLFLEEFARSAGVVDLTDPRLLGALDTLALATRPLIAELRNPFMDSLRVNIELAVPRDTWLRSPEMNVEIGGELIVAYDRGERDLVMVGDLEALRGSYSVLGRPFEVEAGTVGFIGVPGINPTLDIEAVSRIRRVDGDPLDVTANVSGTLIQPRVTLGAQEQGLVESDLVSYLIFGRPSHELATGQQAALRGAATSVVAGTVATAFSAAMAQGIPLDYLSISQAGDFTGRESLQNSFAGTQVEIGQYLSEDVFVVVVLRPLPDQTTGASTFAGARVEWALTDNLTAEGFVEDRFLRNQSLGVRELALASRVLGVFVFREWGY